MTPIEGKQETSVIAKPVALTLFENLQIVKLQEIIPIMEVCHIDFVIIGLGILHPSSLGSAIVVVSNWLSDTCQSVFTLPCEKHPERVNVRILGPVNTQPRPCQEV